MSHVERLPRQAAMSSTHHHFTARHQPSPIAALYAGLALTVGAGIVAFVDHATGNVLADHVRDGYPTYTPRASTRPSRRT
jgi:hypothetical protein